MKKLVYKLSIGLAILHSSLIAYGQTPDWNTSGNTLLQTGVLGNSANFDILFRTDNVNRMRLMETGTYNVDGYTIDNSGFLYLGLTPSALTNREAQSVLHIDGTGNNQGIPQTLGFRKCSPTGRQG